MSRLLRFAQLNLQNVALHSPIKATVTFFDPRGKGTEVPLTLCPSYEVHSIFWQLDDCHVNQRVFKAFPEIFWAHTTLSEPVPRFAELNMWSQGNTSLHLEAKTS